MASIVTITFNPCIDKSTSVAALVPEKKLLCSTPQTDPGGGGINVARAIKKLGGHAIAIFPSGGYTGKFFNHLLEKEEVASVIIETSNETRENIIVLDESLNNQYRFGFPGTPLGQQAWEQCMAAIEAMDDAEFIVASGSLPPGVPTDIYARIARMAKTKKAKFMVDASGEALKHAVEAGVYLIKPNAGELSQLAGKKEMQAGEIMETAREIIKKGKSKIMVVSMGAAGAMLVTETLSEMITPPPVERKSTVGAGDSMVGGMVYYLSLGKSLAEAVQYGVACGTAATIHPGTALCTKADADRLYELMQNKK